MKTRLVFLWVPRFALIVAYANMCAQLQLGDATAAVYAAAHNAFTPHGQGFPRHIGFVFFQLFLWAEGLFTAPVFWLAHFTSPNSGC